METKDRAELYASKVLDRITNDEGEITARVWENNGFKEVYDFNGYWGRNHQLKRRAEQVYFQYHPDTQLFQKVYYSPFLIRKLPFSLALAFICVTNLYGRQR